MTLSSGMQSESEPTPPSTIVRRGTKTRISPFGKPSPYPSTSPLRQSVRPTVIHIDTLAMDGKFVHESSRSKSEVYALYFRGEEGAVIRHCPGDRGYNTLHQFKLTELDSVVVSKDDTDTEPFYLGINFQEHNKYFQMQFTKEGVKSKWPEVLKLVETHCRTVRSIDHTRSAALWDSVKRNPAETEGLKSLRTVKAEEKAVVHRLPVVPTAAPASAQAAVRPLPPSNSLQNPLLPTSIRHHSAALRHPPTADATTSTIIQPSQPVHLHITPTPGTKVTISIKSKGSSRTKVVVSTSQE